MLPGADVTQMRKAGRIQLNNSYLLLQTFLSNYLLCNIITTIINGTARTMSVPRNTWRSINTSASLCTNITIQNYEIIIYS